MARRSTCFLKFTPDYGHLGEPTFISLKIYYNGTMNVMTTSKEYVGGSIEYFDFVDSRKIQMLHLWGFAEELGLKNKERIRFWHNDRYLENEEDVLAIKRHIPTNYEVEIYIEDYNVEADESDTIFDVNIEAEDDDESGSDYGDDDVEEEEFYDSGYDFEEDDRIFDSHVDHDVEMLENRAAIDFGEIPNKVLTIMQNEEGDANCVDIDELVSDSDDDVVEAQKFPLFDPGKDSKNPDLQVGMIFSSRDEAKFAIESHCIRRGKSVKFIKVDKKRLRGKCRNKGCDWVIHVSPMGHDSCWQIKTFQPKHNSCFWDHSNRTASSSWLSKTFVKKFKSNMKLGTIEFKDEVNSTLKLIISRKRAYLAKRKALEMVQGTIQQQFCRIRNYCAELTRVDPSATVILKLTEDDDGPRFQRMYVCFSACKEGFKKACRPVIGVDGCFIKSKNGGQLLAAVGLDPNNNIFPICYAMVERETKDSWMWFLQLLATDIGIGDGYGWTFMSDKQKGLIPAFESLFPIAENRFCVRHLHTNMKRDGFRGLSIKNLLWAAAKATTIAEFRERMDDMKKIDEKAYEWLAKKPEEQWSKSHFNRTPKCDVLLNNMCECFNSLILDAREKPIIPMFETIRNLLMVRFQLNREKAKKWDNKICPNIKKVLANIYMDAAQHSPMQADSSHFQINGPSGQHTVDFATNSCSCRKWDLTGIPCQHAKCYEKSVLPVTGADLWPECALPSPLPPVYTEKVGRPAKLRRRERDEPPSSSRTHLRGARRNNKCKKCGEFGHNKRTCKAPKEIVHEHLTQQSQKTFVASEQIKRKKLQVRRSVAQVSMKTGAASNSTTIDATNMKKHVLVKGGKNFMTVSRLGAILRDQRKQSRLVPVHGDERAVSKNKSASSASEASTVKT
ncbi:uncharacterized protein [Henckelia pumila]|uniref:uncharacterized protein n=1 Tax=Henckelia pumila TaxID=405737 RepID=UPI003C6E5212